MKKTKPTPQKKETKTKIEFLSINIVIDWGKREKQKKSGRGVCGGIGGIFGNGRRRSDQRNFNSRNNQNKRQELKFYPHGTGPDL